MRCKKGRYQLGIALATAWPDSPRMDHSGRGSEHGGEGVREAFELPTGARGSVVKAV